MGSAVADPPSATENELERKRQEAAGETEPGEGAGEGGGEQPAGEGEQPATNGAGNGGPPEGEGGGEFPGEGEEEQGPPPIAIEGEGQLSLQVGGNKPDSATVKLRGGSIAIPAGQLKKGDVVNLLVKVQVAEVHLVDKIDNSTGEITATERRHIAKIKGVEKVAI